MILRSLSYGVCLLILFMQDARGQTVAFEKPRLTVAEGLPQSYVSGLVQDGQGFIWIATRDGLAKYEGRKFKTFRHRQEDTASLSANVITGLCLDREQQLWIQYEGGEIDILNTITERVFHFTKDAVYKDVLSGIKNIKTIPQDNKNRHWLLADKGLFIADLQHHQLHFYSNAKLGLANNPILGIAITNDSLILTTDTAIIIMNLERKIIATWPYTFANPRLFNSQRNWKNNSPVIRKNGDLVIIDEDRLIIYSRAEKTFITRPLSHMKFYLYPPRVQDDEGNILFGFEGYIYMLTAGNEFKIWKEKSPQADEKNNSEKNISMVLDRSGVLWVGTNGYHLRQFDLRVPRMPTYYYTRTFPEDIFEKYLRVSPGELAKTVLNRINPYFFRWLGTGNGKIWIARSGPDSTLSPGICYYQNGSITTDKWYYTDSAPDRSSRISAFALSRSGQLWGIDHFLKLIRFDTVTKAATIVTQLFIDRISTPHSINSMIIDDENIFWISTSLGLIRYDIASQKIRQFKDLLPVSEFTILANDPVDRNTLWTGTLGGGLIRLNKLNYTYQVYTTYDGLPNNTIYAILPFKSQLWCSSNKGIFSFDVQTGLIRSYTTLDGLPVDEFNRFHFLKLPDGRLAFGGTQGYTVFDPRAISNDEFDPPVALTGLKINNKEAGYGVPESRLKQAVNSIDTLSLPHNQNFLVFEFAALEYNIPEKLNYRYIMEGLDNQWIEAATNNTATYTSLPPGRYIFKVNATNTAGKWSRHVKTIHVIIKPPFWLTWWFIALCILLAGSFITLFIRWRLAEIRRQEQQKHRFEKEAIELQAQALRAQMNPHFIFNCLNSIKSLIQENKKQQAVIYLTTFSKLIRNKLNDIHQEISLYNEIQTCRLYVQMELLRFGDRITCDFLIDETIDLHSIKVPPLFLQPLLENAFWHGILPLEAKGQVTVRIEKKENFFYCSVEDNGIGREQSRLNKSKNNLPHDSKGMELIEERLRLHNNNYNTESSLQVLDKKDSTNQPAGTLVIIKFKISHD